MALQHRHHRPARHGGIGCLSLRKLGQALGPVEHQHILPAIGGKDTRAHLIALGFRFEQYKQLAFGQPLEKG